MRGRRAAEPELVARARKRVARMGTFELMEWAETAISGMGRGLADYQREGQVDSLLEIRDEALPALTALIDDLITRDEAQKS